MAHLIRRSRKAKREIYKALEYTKKQWGAAQAWRYATLITDAELTIARNPRCGRSYDHITPGIWGYSIRQPGTSARHILFYRLASTHTMEIVRFLHEAMDLTHRLS
jgi:toxin ParE1/3/4